MQTATLTLPFPPSTNGLFAGMQRRHKSSKYLLWITEAKIALLKQTPLPRFNCRVTLSMRLGKGRANADCSNYIKAAEDALVDMGILKDDCKKWVKGVSIEWDDSLNNQIVIEIQEVTK